MLLRPNTRSCAEKQVVSQPQWYGSDQIPWNIQWDIPWNRYIYKYVNIYICTAMNICIYIWTYMYSYIYTQLYVCVYIYMSRFLNISLKLIWIKTSLESLSENTGPSSKKWCLHRRGRLSREMKQTFFLYVSENIPVKP